MLWVRCFVFVVLMPVLLARTYGRSQSEEGTRLIDLNPVTSGGTAGTFRTTTNKFSIADQICGWGVYNRFNEDSFEVFDLGKRFQSLKGIIGIDDGDSAQQGHFTIAVDGQEVSYGKVQHGKALPLKLDLTGGSSLRITLNDCWIGDPLLSEASVDATTSMWVPRLLSPVDGVAVNGDVELRWTRVGSATSYGVEILAVKLDSADDNAARIIAKTVDGQTRALLKTEPLAPGTYRWSVVAFDDRVLLGKFSEEHTFTISKRGSANIPR